MPLFATLFAVFRLTPGLEAIIYLPALVSAAHALKKNSSDIPSSLPLRLVERLAEEEVQVHGFDPMAMEEVRERTFPLTLHRSALEAARDADALLVLVNWDEFAAPTISPQKLKKVMKNPVIIDMVNSLDGKEFKKAGFTYYGFGQR